MVKAKTIMSLNFDLKKVLHVCRQILIVVAIFFTVQWYQQRNLLPTSANISAPEFQLKEVESGESFSLHDIKDKKLLLYFFAPWCGVCKFSISALQEIYLEVDQTKYAVVAVALSYESKQEILNFKLEHKLSFPVLLGSDVVAAQYRIYAFPTYYVINEQGLVSARDLGFSTNIGMQWRLK